MLVFHMLVAIAESERALPDELFLFGTRKEKN
jgi:hypothetical protein